MGLFKPAWMNDDKEKALRAVEKLTSQPKIVEAARNALLGDVRLAAVTRITSQNVLVDIIKNDEKQYVCVAAAQQLTDKDLLTRIAKTTMDWEVYKTVVAKIADTVILTDLAINSRNVDKFSLNAYSGIPAINQLDSQNALVEIAKKANDEGIRMKAIDKVADMKIVQALLADIAKDERYYFPIRIEALEKIADNVSLTQEVHIDILKQAKNHCFHGTDELEAVWKILRKLTKKEILIDIAQNAKVDSIRFEAEQRLKSLNGLL